MIRADDGQPLGHGVAQRLAVGFGTQWRRETGVAVEIADILVAQMQMMAGDVAGDGKSFPAGRADQGNAGGRGNAPEMQANTGVARQLQEGGDGDCFGADRNPGQSEAGGGFSVMRDAAARQIMILRLQMKRQIEAGGIQHGAQQGLRIGQRPLRLGESDAAGLFQNRELGQFFTGQPLG